MIITGDVAFKAPRFCSIYTVYGIAAGLPRLHPLSQSQFNINLHSKSFHIYSDIFDDRSECKRTVTVDTDFVRSP